MAAACALAIISGIGFLFGIQKSLRAFLNPLFTGGVVKVSGLALSVTYGDSSPKGRASGETAHFAIKPGTLPLLVLPHTLRLNRKLYRYAKGSPFGRAGALAPERARTLPLRSRTFPPEPPKALPCGRAGKAVRLRQSGALRRSSRRWSPR